MGPNLWQIFLVLGLLLADDDKENDCLPFFSFCDTFVMLLQPKLGGGGAANTKINTLSSPALPKVIMHGWTKQFGNVPSN